MLESHSPLPDYHFILVSLVVLFSLRKKSQDGQKKMYYCRIVKIVVQDINHTETHEFLADNKCVIDWSLKSHAYYEHNPHFNAGS